MKFTWLIFFQILRTILDFLINLPAECDPREACRDIKTALDDVDPNNQSSASRQG